ncbi:MAG: hypothetical protein ISR00_07055 [Flavobacteriales bacterium]|nr:hypothetical protein [Flavobacteriales bacterium]MBL6873681.1 hypothetical protein [Flavobacteriales bacterium]
MKRILFQFIFLLIFKASFAQFNTPLSHAYYANFEKDSHAIGISEHTSIKPFKLSLNDTSYYSSIFPIETKKTYLHNFLNDNLFFVKSKNYDFYVNPLLHLEIGADDENRYVNTRGIELKGRIGDKVRFNSSFYENQMNVSDYIYDYMLTHDRVVPGQGMAKKNNSVPNSDLDFYFSQAYVNYDANDYFNFEIGHGKHFFGDGYRSMLLSDNSFNYPYFKITTSIWKVKYVNLFSSLQQIDWDSETTAHNGFPDLSREKFNATHYLSANIGSRLTLNIFESIILGEDSLGNVFDINYLNPIIFYRPVEYSVSYSRQGNAIMGLGFKYKLSDLSHLYGQVVLDEFTLSELRARNGYWANKFGGQIGFKCFDLFGYENLSFQTEINSARPFTFSHKSPILSYAHYSQPLAHPLGANFIENVSILRYRKDRWTADLKVVVAQHGGQIDGDSRNYGSDILVSYDENREDYGNEVAQGNTTDLQFVDFRVGYLINPITNLKLEVGVSSRNTEDLSMSTENQYLFFGLKTDLRNIYYDF